MPRKKHVAGGEGARAHVRIARLVMAIDGWIDYSRPMIRKVAKELDPLWESGLGVTAGISEAAIFRAKDVGGRWSEQTCYGCAGKRWSCGKS